MALRLFAAAAIAHLSLVEGARPKHHTHSFTPGELLELRVYLDADPQFRGFNITAPVWHEVTARNRPTLLPTR
jgi:hypothetical protein